METNKNHIKLLGIKSIWSNKKGGIIGFAFGIILLLILIIFFYFINVLKLFLKREMGPPGVEPGTPWSSVMCSPAELRSQFKLMFSTFKCLEIYVFIKNCKSGIGQILSNFVLLAETNSSCWHQTTRAARALAPAKSPVSSFLPVRRSPQGSLLTESGVVSVAELYITALRFSTPRHIIQLRIGVRTFLRT